MYFGVGINDLDYVVSKTTELQKVNGVRKRKRKIICPYFRKWSDMLSRCYRKNGAKTYSETYVCEEWLLASNFKAWMEKQDWEGKELDKDLLGDGKLYSPETCCFLPKSVNSFIKHSSNTTHLPVGVTLHKGRYIARINNRGSYAKNLGSFYCQTAASLAYKKAKVNYALTLVDEISDETAKEVFMERYCSVRN